MTKLDPEQVKEYLQRSYTAVDGLWFMKVEEDAGFDKALDIDEKVWQVMPKIQARAMKKILGQGSGIMALRKCFEEKLTLDGFGYSVETFERSFMIVVLECPWHEKLVKSNRAHLAEKISNRICSAEYNGWAKEFGCTFDFACPSKVCNGCRDCRLTFKEGV